VVETVFFIHGMWGGAWCWDGYREVFEAAGYRCVAPGLRFHELGPAGAPDARLGTTSLLDYVADLEEEIARLGIKPILVGHSMGGLLAQILASRGLGKALVLLAPAPPAGIVGLRPSNLRAFWHTMTRWGFWRRPMRPTFAEAVDTMLFRLSPTEQRQAYRRLVFESGRAACETGFWFLDPHRASQVDAAKVTCPVLAIAGGRDRMTPPAVVRRIAAKYRAAEYLEFPDNAHWMIGEPGWREVAEFVVAWLARSAPDTLEPRK
jgi:pimeloyl-ACP methyl ester carboxylesterase